MSGRRVQALGLPIVAVLVLVAGGWLLRMGDQQEPSAVPQPNESQLTVTVPVTPLPTASSPTQEGQAIPTLVPEPGSVVTRSPQTTEPGDPALPTAAVSEAQLEAVLQRMTLEQKVAQMIMVGVPGPTLDGVARRLVADVGVGGVILLERNLENPAQLRGLTTGLQQAALTGSSQLPLFIGWNHEGGDIVRANAGVTLFPSAMALGSLNDPALTLAVARATAAEMSNLGVNMNYAPVLDVNVEHANPVIGLRSFGEDPASVAQHGAQFIAGLQGAGVIAVGKHFPGHGRVDVDSHLELPTLHASVEQLWQVELPPFVAVLDSVDAVMVAHLNIPALDASGRPSSLSPVVVTGLLRQQLGYEGVIMTDDLGMGAIANHYGLEEAAVMAVEAGNDLLLTIEPSHAQRIVNALAGAVRSGRLDEAQVDASVRRLLRLKQQYRLHELAEGSLLPQQSAHQQQALELGAAAVREVRDDAQWIPLPQQPERLLLVSPLTLNPGSSAGDGWSALAEQFMARGVAVTELFYDPTLSGSPQLLQARVLEEMGQVDAAIFVLWDSALHFEQRGDTGQEQLAATLLAQQKPVILVSAHLPYDDLRLADAPALVNLYGDRMGQLMGLVALLLGDNQ